VFYFANATNCSKLSTFIDKADPMIEFKPQGDDVRMNIAKLKPGGKKVIPEYKNNTPFFLHVEIVGYCSSTVVLMSAAKDKKELLQFVLRKRKRNQDIISSHCSNTDFVMSDPLTTSTSSVFIHEHTVPHDFHLPMDSGIFSENGSNTAFGMSHSLATSPYEHDLSTTMNSNYIKENSGYLEHTCPGIFEEGQNYSPKNDLNLFPILKEVVPKVVQHESPVICIFGNFYERAAYNVRVHNKKNQEIHTCTCTCQDTGQLCIMANFLSPGKYRITVNEFAFGLDLDVV